MTTEQKIEAAQKLVAIIENSSKKIGKRDEVNYAYMVGRLESILEYAFENLDEDTIQFILKTNVD